MVKGLEHAIHLMTLKEKSKDDSIPYVADSMMQDKELV